MPDRIAEQSQLLVGHLAALVQVFGQLEDALAESGGVFGDSLRVERADGFGQFAAVAGRERRSEGRAGRGRC